MSISPRQKRGCVSDEPVYGTINVEVLLLEIAAVDRDEQRQVAIGFFVDG